MLANSLKLWKKYGIHYPLQNNVIELVFEIQKGLMGHSNFNNAFKLLVTVLNHIHEVTGNDNFNIHEVFSTAIPKIIFRVKLNEEDRIAINKYIASLFKAASGDFSFAKEYKRILYRIAQSAKFGKKFNVENEVKDYIRFLMKQYFIGMNNKLFATVQTDSDFYLKFILIHLEFFESFIRNIEPLIKELSNQKIISLPCEAALISLFDHVSDTLGGSPNSAEPLN